jgi:hypothetical protein
VHFEPFSSFSSSSYLLFSFFSLLPRFSPFRILLSLLFSSPLSLFLTRLFSSSSSVLLLSSLCFSFLVLFSLPFPSFFLTSLFLPRHPPSAPSPTFNFSLTSRQRKLSLLEQKYLLALSVFKNKHFATYHPLSLKGGKKRRCMTSVN